MKAPSPIEMANYLLETNALRYRIANTNLGLVVQGGDSEWWVNGPGLGIIPGVSHYLTANDAGWLFHEVRLRGEMNNYPTGQVQSDRNTVKDRLKAAGSGVWEARGVGFLRCGGESYLVPFETLRYLSRKQVISLRTTHGRWLLDCGMQVPYHRCYVRYVR